LSLERCGDFEVLAVEDSEQGCKLAVTEVLALRSYAEKDAQRPLLEVRADSHVGMR